jgi:hypothetical protein
MADKGAVDDDMATDSKVEPPRDGTPSSIESTPEHEEEQPEQEQEPAQPVKRKGGRKPVRLADSCLICASSDYVDRYTPRPKSASNAIDKHKQRFENGGPSTSSSSKLRSSRMKRHYQACNRVNGRQPTNVSCCATRTRFWSGSCLEKGESALPLSMLSVY